LNGKPRAPLVRTFSVSVPSMSSFRTASSSGERSESVSLVKVGDFGMAFWSFLAFSRISSASSTKVGAVLLIEPMGREGRSLLLKVAKFQDFKRKNGMCWSLLIMVLFVTDGESSYDPYSKDRI
jgi:hypothetical protein